MVLPITKLKTLVAWGVFFHLALVSTLSADTRTTDDYIALVVEAEDDESRGERWVLMDAQTGTQENDPDGNHSDGAAGGAYIELLPDIRVTHDDEFGPPTAYWDTPGAGPQAVYPMTFPEAGRYYVHIRGYSTGTEDNGIHVGLNDEWPQSGARMQFCTAGTGWQWSGRQRDSGGVGPCGAKKTIWITVDEPGEHRFMISAREDGFEADRIMLIKDLSDNTRICSPSGEDDISCVSGSLENIDDVVDMAMSATVDSTAIDIDSSISLTLLVENTDGYDTAADVEINLDAGIGTQWEATSLPDGCQVQDEAIVCSLGNVGPTGPEDERSYEFILTPLQAGSLTIPMAISTSSVDDDQTNDESTVMVDVVDIGTLSLLNLQLNDTELTWNNGSETLIVATISNTGLADATDVEVNVSIPGGLTLSTVPSECIGVSELQCTFASVAVDEPLELALGVTPSAEGMYSISYEADAANQNGDSVASTVIFEAGAMKTSSSGAMAGWSMILLSLVFGIRRTRRVSR